MSQEAISKPYVDFQYYSNTYGGNSVGENEFDKYEIKSRSHIDKCTFKRIQHCINMFPGFVIPDEIKNAQCEIIDYMKSVDANGGKIVSSESVSKHSVTYMTKSFDKEIAGIAEGHISAYPWRYRGIGGVFVDTGDKNYPVQCIP